MKTYDCFTFFNELDVLEFRLQELYDTVDHFVIAEANMSHSGKPKEYWFNIFLNILKCRVTNTKSEPWEEVVADDCNLWQLHLHPRSELWQNAKIREIAVVRLEDVHKDCLPYVLRWNTCSL